MPLNPSDLLNCLFEAAVEAVVPSRCVPKYLPAPPKGRTIILGAGKASAAMAAAVEKHWDGALSGLIVTRYGHAVPTTRIEVVEAGHPVPDAAGMEAAQRILAFAHEAEADDLVLCLISGGGSALLSLPPKGLTLDDKQTINRALLKSGATIAEMNCVRKHLSAVKGGRLALAAAPAQVVSLLISDVPGDDPAIIASGPTVADPSTSEEACHILKKYKISIPTNVEEHLRSNLAETPKPNASAFHQVQNILVATPQEALTAAAEVARENGITPIILGDDIEGESSDIALMHASIARQIAKYHHPATPPCVLISGGETTVTVKGNGRGGRNTEFLLGLGIALNGYPGIHAIACDTDGIDGSEDNAGAILTSNTLVRAEALGLNARAFLDANDAYSFFQALGDLVVPGPTHTNVNDFRAILIM